MNEQPESPSSCSSAGLSHNLTFPENAMITSTCSSHREKRSAKEQLCGVFSVDLGKFAVSLSFLVMFFCLLLWLNVCRVQFFSLILAYFLLALLAVFFMVSAHLYYFSNNFHSGFLSKVVVTLILQSLLFYSLWTFSEVSKDIFEEHISVL